MASAAGMADRMQCLASSPTQKLLFDYSETQTFYLYSPGTGAIQQVASQAAKTWFSSTGNVNFIAPGLTFWGFTIMPEIIQHQQTANIPKQITGTGGITTDEGTFIITDDSGTHIIVPEQVSGPGITTDDGTFIITDDSKTHIIIPE